ncbi:MAG: NAD(P)-dependent glycerol-3-phosphate dehydrogenase [Candidatus Microthrix sp.]|nr:NAD(P)H-dependent glycerol-3-phosphate dehydrogenase [Candidatus Microthrix sp.]MBK6437701.1 NAD(P)-dependent glycerol-3-phosphate dehydrogenase [Candidatus Microthrix sp.]
MNVAVLGAGAWGTTVASLLAVGNDTTVWSHEAEVVDEITLHQRNPMYLPDIELCPSLRATADLQTALQAADMVVFAVPSRYFRAVVERARPDVPTDADLVSVTKGIELETGFRMSEVLIDVLDHDPDRVCVLSGPNLAKEVALGQPSATVLACSDAARAERLRQAFTTDSFRAFSNSDVIGCEVAGAVKNVIAIAAGIGDGLGYGWNTKAALITRGLAEIARLGVAMGAQPITFLGLAGNGDLTATCSSPQSRNQHLGEELGRGRSLSDITAGMLTVAEGVSSTPAIAALAQRLGVPMPITRKVEAVLNGSLSARAAVDQLMQFEPGAELEDIH